MKTLKLSLAMLLLVAVGLSSCKKKAISVEQTITFDGFTNRVLIEPYQKQKDILYDGGIIVVFLKQSFESYWHQAPFLNENKVQFNVLNSQPLIEITARDINKEHWEYPFNGVQTYDIKMVAIPAETKFKMEQEKFDYKKATYKELSAKL